MCGIAGSVGSFTAESIESAAASLSHRGPDDLGFWSSSDGKCHLAHRRLSILDTSSLGHQPMWDSSETCIVVFNGEIYNFKELREKLLRTGCRLRSNTDTEVLVNLYRTYGADFVKELNGIFAFAIYDSRSQKTFLARDKYGVKPLYYSQVQQGVVFASEIRALIRIPEIPKELNPQAIAGYLGLQYAPDHHTPLKAIKKWPAGILGEIASDGSVSEIKDFNCPIESIDQHRTSTPAELQALLDQAVSRQLVADTGVGAFLSGGTDSAAIVTSASKLGKPLSCYTLRLREHASGRDMGTEDLPYARAVAKHCGSSLTEVDVAISDLRSIDEFVRMLEEPHPVPSAMCTFVLSQRARNDGIKVMLSGTGADEIFGGYRRHLVARAFPLWMWMPNCVRVQLARVGREMSVESPVLRRFGKLLANIDEDQDGQTAALNLWISDFHLRGILTENFKNDPGVTGNFDVLRRQMDEMPSGLSWLSKSLLLDQKNFLTEQCLNYSDKMGMAAGVEVRVPFLDNDLVEFANRLPDHQKCGWGGNKILLKKALALRLPRELVYRPKRGFGIPLRQWMLNELGDCLDEYISSDRIVTQGIFEPSGLRQMIQLDREGKLDATYTLYAVLCIDSWIRQFLPKGSL